jgi:capsular polysaccharide transport system permease protein
MNEGARRQGNVIFALIFRELKTKQGQDGYGILSLVGVLLEPAVGVMAMSAFWYILKRQEIKGVHVVLFLTISMTAFAIVRRSLSSIPKTVRTSRAFFAFPSVKPFDAILARFIIECVLTMCGGLLLLFLSWWFLDLTIRMDRFIEGMGIFGLLLGIGFGTSLLIGVYGTRFPFVFTVLSNVSRALLFLSAVMHPVSELPHQAQGVISWNPLSHAMELIRGYLLGIQPFADVSIEYLVGFSLATLFLGFISYYVNRRKVIER